MMRTLKLTIAYDGTNYSGWQRQKNSLTIQEEIETRLHRITTTPVSVHGAGRTDAGVHATGMVAHFLTDASLDCPSFGRALNSMLPVAIRILDVSEEAEDFHARYSARAKTYLYTFFTGTIQLPTERLYAVHIPRELDIAAMQQCLHSITGTHDFASFEATGSRDTSVEHGRGSTRTLFEAKAISQDRHNHQFVITGDGFLRHMVRNIAGTLFHVGQGRLSVEEFNRIVAARDRTVAGPTAPAHGLSLYQIMY